MLNLFTHSLINFASTNNIEDLKIRKIYNYKNIYFKRFIFLNIKLLKINVWQIIIC